MLSFLITQITPHLLLWLTNCYAKVLFLSKMGCRLIYGVLWLSWLLEGLTIVIKKTHIYIVCCQQNNVEYLKHGYVDAKFTFLSLCLLSDEVSAIVVDLGSYSCKAGYAGEDAPKAVFPSVTFISCMFQPQSQCHLAISLKEIFILLWKIGAVYYKKCWKPHCWQHLGHSRWVLGALYQHLKIK